MMKKKRNECERRRKKNTCGEYWYALDCVSNNFYMEPDAHKQLGTEFNDI